MIHLVYCDTIPPAVNQSIAIQTHLSQYNLPAFIQPHQPAIQSTLPNQLHTLAIQLKPKLHYGHNTMVYCDTNPAPQAASYCNTITALQYNSHNIIWAVAQPMLLHQNFLFFFHQYYYLFQALEIPKKNTHTHFHFFFHLPIPLISNYWKITKITKNQFFFLPFSLTLK